MSVDPYVALTGVIVGLIVDMTGMGGGALMTPTLVLLFKVQPLAAISSDLVASMIMKPVGGAVHWRRGTVRKDLVGWLTAGSVPAAFAGVLVIRLLGRGTLLQDRLQVVLGVVLVLAATAVIVKGYLRARPINLQHTRRSLALPIAPSRLRKPATALVGAAGGLIVGMTSVGSGSLIIVFLMLLYPALRSAELVGTDLVQAVPLVASAAVAHLLFGDFRPGLTASILLGSIPGVYAGAKLSSFSPDWVVRPALIFILLASGLRLIDAASAAFVPTLLLSALCAAAACFGAARPRVPMVATADVPAREPAAQADPRD